MMGSTVREGTVDPYKNKPNSALESAALSHLHATEYNYVIRLIQKGTFFAMRFSMSSLELVTRRLERFGLHESEKKHV